LTLFDIASEFARPEMAELLQTYSEAFHAELGSNIVETTSSNSSEDGSGAFYTRYSKDHVNLDLVIEVIGFALGYTEPGTILVILPGYSEMLELRDMINSNHPEMKDRLQVLVLHSYLQLADYNKLFKPAEEGKRKVILATPMVESAVSFDDVSCVVDSGLIRDRENDAIAINPRKTSPISKVCVTALSI
jgi:HrpA-like RNA helicase